MKRVLDSHGIRQMVDGKPDVISGREQYSKI